MLICPLGMGSVRVVSGCASVIVVSFSARFAHCCGVAVTVVV